MNITYETDCNKRERDQQGAVFSKSAQSADFSIRCDASPM